MSEKGFMRVWVLAGMTQNDYVHLTAPGYRMIGATPVQMMQS
jgi:hypothetical protein